MGSVPTEFEGETDVWLEVLSRELSRGENLDALVPVNHKQMPITATHNFRIGGKRTGDVLRDSRRLSKRRLRA